MLMNILAKYRLRKYHQKIKEAEKALQSLDSKPKEHHLIIEKTPLIKTKYPEIKLKKRIVKEYSFINKNANFILLLFILILLGAVSGSSIFFNLKFSDLKKDYDTSVEKINKLTQDLTSNKQTLTNLQQNLEVKKEREQGISQQFLDVKKENENLKQQVSQLTSTNARLSSDIASKDATIKSLKNEIDDLKQQLGQ